MQVTTGDIHEHHIVSQVPTFDINTSSNSMSIEAPLKFLFS